MANAPLLRVKDLCISFGKKKREKVIHEVSFEIERNEILGIVGESGSGKSVTSMAIMGLLQKVNTHISGEIEFEGQSLINLGTKEWQKLQGNEIAMIFQEPMSALNPSIRCGEQVSEMIRLHRHCSKSEAKKETLSLFEKVKLPEPKELYKRYPHQISGGQMQRVMIAMAISCKPKLLIADEPTTALDVTVQKEILELLKSLQAQTGMSLLFISHDLALVSELAEKVVVMYQGKVEETGSVFQIFKTPKSNYTKALLASRPPVDRRLEQLPTIQSLANKEFKAHEISPQERALRHKKLYMQEALLEIQNLKKYYYQKASFWGSSSEVRAVDDVSFSVFEGETLGLVGESGCGKSTLGKTLLQLEKATAGSVWFRGKDITKIGKKELQQLRKEIQIIFQDPYSSLNPRMPIGEAIMEPMKVHKIGSSDISRKRLVKELLVKVGLDEDYFSRFPHELSGGQRQRVGIARTIALKPKLVICDESVSALDISVQAQVLNLLNSLKEDYGFTYIFISHDLAVVKFMADQLLVMNKGQIEEIGDADEIYAHPSKAYTKHLIDAIPKGI